MSCSKYHYLLSQNLDGRLSSTRRESLLDHLAECSACSDLAAEMREAQHLALNLPREQVGASFQDTLWDRIRAGEGSPEATFHEPVPFAVRLRYIAAGAAAAALFLLALNWFGPDAETPTTDKVASESHVGNDDTNLVARDARPTLRSRTHQPFELLTSSQINPTHVAQVVQRETIRSVNDLQTYAASLEPELERGAAPQIRQAIAEPLRNFRSSTSLMRWLCDAEFIELPGETRSELSEAERVLRALSRANEADSIRRAFEDLRNINSENFSRRFSIVCCDTQATFLDQLQEQVVREPEVTCVLRVVIPGRHGLRTAPDAGSNVLRDGAWLVVPQAQEPAADEDAPRLRRREHR